VICPKCGEGAIVYAEDVTQYRRVEGMTADGEVSIAGEVYSETDGDNARWICDTCGQESPIVVSVAFDAPIVDPHEPDCDLDDDCTCR